jgi:hypothetical protein
LGYIFKDFCFCCWCVYNLFTFIYKNNSKIKKIIFFKKIAKQLNAKQAIKVYPLQKRSGVQFKPIFKTQRFHSSRTITQLQSDSHLHSATKSPIFWSWKPKQITLKNVSWFQALSALPSSRQPAGTGNNKNEGEGSSNFSLSGYRCFTHWILSHSLFLYI